jgi:hypothetical protein
VSQAGESPEVVTHSKFIFNYVKRMAGMQGMDWVRRHDGKLSSCFSPEFLTFFCDEPGI